MKVTEKADLPIPASSDGPAESGSLGGLQRDVLSDELSGTATPATKRAVQDLKPQPKKSRKSAKGFIPAVVQSQVRELFWLELQSPEEIKEALEKDWPKTNKKTISELVGKTIREDTADGVRDGNGNKYIFTKAGLFKLSGSGDKMTSIKIMNFRVLSLTSIVRDDGEQQQNSLRLELGLDKMTTTIEIDPEEFRQMNWHFPLFDQHAIVMPKMKEYAVVGIQHTAPRKPTITKYTSTGWFVIDDQPYFLHNDGAIGATQHRRDLKAELKENLQRYSLPDPPKGEALQKAIRATLDFLKVGDASIAVPMFASVWRAPLGKVDFLAWAKGVTNSLKTSHAIVAQQFYGKDFDKKHLPATWSSTANFNLARLHSAKDVFTLIDDFVLRGGRTDEGRQQSEADRFVRGVADGAFRGRLDAKHSDDTPTRGPRGLAWSTAETNPLRHSGQARMVNLTYQRTDDGTPISINSDKLRACQRDAENGLYAQAMAAFIAFLAEHHNLIVNVNQRVRELSSAMSESLQEGLLRTPEILASLAVGIEYFLYFAKDAEAIDDEEYQSTWSHCWTTLASLGEGQTERLRDEDPARETLRLLKSVDQAGRLMFRSPSLGEDDYVGGDSVTVDKVPNSNHSWNDWFVGWREGNNSNWLCDPEQLWKIIQTLFTEQGRAVPKRKVELFEEMEQGGWITPRERGRAGAPTVKRAINGERLRVIEIPARSFARLEEDSPKQSVQNDRKAIRVPSSSPNEPTSQQAGQGK